MINALFASSIVFLLIALIALVSFAASAIYQRMEIASRCFVVGLSSMATAVFLALTAALIAILRTPLG